MALDPKIRKAQRHELEREIMDLRSEVTRLRKQRAEDAEAAAARRAELALARSVYHMRGAAIAVIGKDTQILSLNPACQEMTGLDVTQARGEVFSVHFAPESEEESIDNVLERLLEGQLQTAKRDLWTRTPHAVRLSWTFYGATDESGGVDYIVAMGVDITNLAQTENAFREAEQLLHGILGAATDVICVLDRYSNVVLSNQRGEEGFDAVLPETELAAQRAIQQDEPQRFDHWNPDTGQTFDVRLTPVRNHKEEPVAALQVIRDVTEQKEAEEAAKARQRQLVEGVQQAPYGVLALNELYEVELANQAFADIVGRHLEGVDNAAALWQRLFPDPGDRQRAEELWGEAVENGQSRYELEIATEDDQRRTVEFRYAALAGGAHVLMAADLTGIRDAEKRMRQSQLAFEALVASLPGMSYRRSSAETWVLDFVNEGCEALTGYSRDAFMRSEASFGELIHPEDRERHAAAVREAAESGAGYHAEFRITHRQGETRWLLENGRAVPPVNGDGSHISAYVSDVTEFKRVERERNAAYEELRSLIDASPMAIALLDAEDRVTVWNPAAEELLAWPAQEARGTRLPESYPPLSEVAAPLLERGKGGETIRNERLTLPRADGGMVEVDLSAAPLRDERGRYAGAVALAADVTESKRLRNTLREREDRLRVVFEHSPLGVAVFDASGLLIDCNERLAAMLGAERERFAGSASLDDVTSASMRATLESALAGETGRFEGEYVSSFTGRTALVRCIFGPLRGAEDQVIGCMGVIEDIAEERRREEEQRRLEQRMQHMQKLESLNRMAGGVAHDFNNLLMGILGNSSLALLELDDDSGARESVDQIGKAARQAAELCKHMLAFAGRGPVEMRPLDLASMAREALPMLRAGVSSEARLKCRFLSAPAEADASQMTQVLMNLAANASEAFESGAGDIRIMTGTRECSAGYLAQCAVDGEAEPGTYAFISVADTGAGMDNATREKIFDPFFSTKFTGRGLGLAAVHGIVKAHGGCVHVESAPGEGTTVTVLLPQTIAAVEAPEEPADWSNPVWRGEGAVLVVDDEATVLRVASRMIEKTGMTPVPARGGRQALDIINDRGDEIDLAIIDMAMPDMSGLETLQAIRETAPHLRVILSSGVDPTETGERPDDEHVVAFLQKPYTFSELSKALAQAQS